VSSKKQSVIDLPTLLPADPVSYMPATPAAIAISVLLGLMVLWVLIARLQRFQRNRYRRAARASVRQLAVQVAAGDLSCSRAAARLNQLLKRTALAAGGERKQVAVLAGTAWWSWLDSTMPTVAGCSFSAVGEQWQRQLWQLQSEQPSRAEWHSWLALSERWIARHTLAAQSQPE